METLIAVHFRRERTYVEMRDDDSLGQWVELGCMMMPEVPSMDSFIFVNGQKFKVHDVTWSIRLPDEIDGPNYDDPQVMITLINGIHGSGSYSPQSDFFK